MYKRQVSITGNSTNPTRFQHPVAGTYKKERVLAGKPYFSVAAGGGTGRTLHPDNMAAGPASVSYTHLDVYKRQTIFLPISCTSPFTVASNTFPAEVVPSTFSDSDVYKRQSISCLRYSGKLKRHFSRRKTTFIVTSSILQITFYFISSTCELHLLDVYKRQSIDWEMVGNEAANFVLNNVPIQKYMPTEVRLRKSL